jgi:hypothetical protein
VGCKEVFDAGGKPGERDGGESWWSSDRFAKAGIAGAIAAGGDGYGDAAPPGEQGDERVDGGQVWRKGEGWVWAMTTTNWTQQMMASTGMARRVWAAGMAQRGGGVVWASGRRGA